VLVGDAAMFIDPIFSSGVTPGHSGGIFAMTVSTPFRGAISVRRVSNPTRSASGADGPDRRIIHNWYELLDREDGGNMLLRAQRIPWLRERLIVLLSGGYEKMDLESFLLAASYSAV
jgi:hypothetical protein